MFYPKDTLENKQKIDVISLGKEFFIKDTNSIILTELNFNSVYEFKIKISGKIDECNIFALIPVDKMDNYYK